MRAVVHEPDGAPDGLRRAAPATARTSDPTVTAAGPTSGRITPVVSIHVVLVHPEIHWNTGNAGRTCLAAGATLHLVEPLGFSLDRKASPWPSGQPPENRSESPCREETDG
jgi:hypothetical protein